MSKKKKKIVKQTPVQKLKTALSHGAQTARSSAGTARSRLIAAGGRTYTAMQSFIALRWSAAPLAVLMFALTMLVYAVNGRMYLTSSVFLYFPSTVTYHLFDYSVGFISRALVGEIITWFTDTVSLELVLRISRATVFTLFVLQSAVAALVFKKAFLKKNYVICAAAVAFVSSPITVLSFVYNLGLLDQYNLVLTVLFLYISDTKAALVLTPVICVLGLLVHHEFAYALMPAVFLILLYYICTEKRLRRARIACLAFSACVAGALTAYFVFFEKNHLTMTEPELNAYLAGKFKEYDTFGIYTDYYTFYFFGKDGGGTYGGLFDKIKRLIDLTLSNTNKTAMIRIIAVLSPFYALLAYFWICALRRAKKIQKLPYLGFLLLPLTLAATWLISDDLLRFADESFVENFMLLAAVVKKDDPYVNGAVRSLQKHIDRPWKRAAATTFTAAWLVVAVLLYTVFLHG